MVELEYEGTPHVTDTATRFVVNAGYVLGCWYLLIFAADLAVYGMPHWFDMAPHWQRAIYGLCAPALYLSPILLLIGLNGLRRHKPWARKTLLAFAMIFIASSLILALDG